MFLNVYYFFYSLTKFYLLSHLFRQVGDGQRIQREHRVDYIVHRLIEAAAQPERLCQMHPTWMPWL